MRARCPPSIGDMENAARKLTVMGSVREFPLLAKILLKLPVRFGKHPRSSKWPGPGRAATCRLLKRQRSHATRAA